MATLEMFLEKLCIFVPCLIYACGLNDYVPPDFARLRPTFAVIYTNDILNTESSYSVSPIIISTPDVSYVISDASIYI